jgi:hypothetical protein
MVSKLMMHRYYVQQPAHLNALEMTVYVYNTIAYSSIVSILIPLIFYFRKIKNQAKHHRTVGIYLCSCLLFDAVNFVLYFQGYSTVISVNLFYILTFITMNVLYFQLIYKDGPKTIFFAGIGIYSVSLIYAVSSQGIGNPHSALWAISGVIIAIHSVIYTNTNFFKTPDNLLDLNLNSTIIINGSLSFYFIATIFLFLATTFFFEELTADMRRLSWSFHNGVNILKNIGIAVGLYYTGRRKVDITIEQLEEMDRRLQHAKRF